MTGQTFRHSINSCHFSFQARRLEKDSFVSWAIHMKPQPMSG